MKTKITTITTISALIISVILFSSCAEEYFAPESHGDRTYYDIDGIYYGVEENSVTAAVSGFDERQGCMLTVPAEVTITGRSYIVTEIEDFAFFGTGIEDLILPPSILTIGRYSFHKCDALRSITLSGPVCPSCSNSAFNTASYKTVTITHPTIMTLESPFDRFKNTRQY